MVVRKLLTRRWMITTLLVIAAVGVMIRLGFWQLDRLSQRRASNAQIEAQINQLPLELNQALINKSLSPDQLNHMQYRKIVVRGKYHFQEQVILRNQVWESQPGFHLLTPLYLDGAPYAILIDRGWIPFEDSKPASWSQFDVPGMVTVQGQIALAQNPRQFGVADPTLASGQARLDAWNAVNLDQIKSQVQDQLLPVFAEAVPDPSINGMPFRQLDQPDLTEGPHESYAIQWFSFAAILGAGYPYFISKQLHDEKAGLKSSPQPQGKNI